MGSGLNWVEERIEIAQSKDGCRAKAREWLMYSEKVFQTKMPTLWRVLFSQVEQIVKKWNEVHGRNDPRWIEFQAVIPDGLLARRAQFPTLALSVWLDKDDRSVLFKLVSKIDRQTTAKESHGRLRIVLMEEGDGELHLFNGDELLDDETAARLIVEPLLQ